MRLVASHELVHALQDQYLRLDSIINQHRENDRRSAAQAVLEGQATFYQISILMPEQHPESLPEGGSGASEKRWPSCSRRCRILRCAALAAGDADLPVSGGCGFISWFVRTHPEREPYGAAMPLSTEQILHPDRYDANDEPLALSFEGPGVDTVRYEDGLGEFEIGLLFSELLRDSTEERSRLGAGLGGRPLPCLRQPRGCPGVVLGVG